MDAERDRQAREDESTRIYRAATGQGRFPELEPRHTESCQVLPSRLVLLERLPHDAVVAEVGVAFGDFSREILRLARPRKLHLIDVWSSDRYGPGQSLVRSRLEQELGSGQVEINRGLSTEVLAGFPDGYFDWIYIDTSHAYDLTLEELRIGSRKVKDAGLLCGHDFSAGNVVAPVVYGVIQACNQFCREAGWRYRHLTLETGTAFSYCLERLPD